MCFELNRPRLRRGSRRAETCICLSLLGLVELRLGDLVYSIVFQWPYLNTSKTRLKRVSCCRLKACRRSACIDIAFPVVGGLCRHDTSHDYAGCHFAALVPPTGRGARPIRPAGAFPVRYARSMKCDFAQETVDPNLHFTRIGYVRSIGECRP